MLVPTPVLEVVAVLPLATPTTPPPIAQPSAPDWSLESTPLAASLVKSAPSVTLPVSATVIGASSTILMTKFPAVALSPSASLISTAKVAVVLSPLVFAGKV